jgi:O-antigen/teichoic acid export membrane protein
MAPGVWIKAAAKPTTSYFIGINRPGIVSLSTGVEFVASLILMPVLFRRFGLVGAAAAATGAYLLSSCVLLLAFQISSGLGFRAIWHPRRADFTRLVALGHRFWPKVLRGRA